ncbi:MATE family efflux transporter [Agaribacterium haliotis]|uniref:MATE family efflux transporter n=1 Tax=Agaribacterium haliotis TaxID=2013869 RepID=UPI000BB52CDA|nr:MATE family efflux transporter [Agaribacterium haliotis]
MKSKLNLHSFDLRRALSLAWPISLQGVLTNLISIVDVAMVSHLGDTAVAAVGLGNRYQFMLMVILLGCAWTVGVLSAQYYGAGQQQRIRSTIILATAVALCGLLPALILTWLFSANIIGLGGEQIDFIKQGSLYINICVPSLAFVAVVLVYENAVRALGQSKLPLVFSASAIGLNIVLNYWFINGGWGLPAMGVAGAAWATLVARLIHAASLVLYLQFSQHPLALRRIDFKFESRQARHIISMAAPMMGSFGVWAVGIFVYQLIYGSMGTSELAIISMLTPIEAIFLALFFGLASACSISIGQLLGADKFEQARLYAKAFCMMNIGIAVLLGALLYIAAPLVLLPFQHMPADSLLRANDLMLVIALLSWLKVSNMTLAMGILRAGGDNTIVMWIDVVGMWLISLPLCACATFLWNWPLFWVVLLSYSEELSKAVLFTLRVIQGRWQRNLSHH